MRLSILITNHNYGRFLAAAIDSCLHQLRDGDEVIVVDDGSTDGSLHVARAYGGDIRLVAKRNGGQASAWNSGAAASSGEAICLLDADDIFVAGKLDAVRHALSQGAQWCFHPLMPVGSRLERIAEPASSPVPSVQQLTAARERGRMPYLPTASSGMSFRRALAQRLFPMPEEAGVLLSDNYLKFRSVAAADGVFLAKCWALQRLHDANHYTGTADRRSRAAVIGVTTAWHLAITDSALAPFSRRLFITAATELLATQGCSAWARHPLARRYAATHLGVMGRIELAVRAVWQRGWRLTSPRWAAP